MATDPDFLEHVLDLFGYLGELRTGRMFSGTAIYAEGDAMFACVLGDTVWMKSDAESEPAFRAAGSEPFEYARKAGRQQITSLMRLPETALDDPEEALRWARLSLPAARAAAARRR